MNKTRECTLLVVDDSLSTRMAVRYAVKPANIFTNIIEAHDGVDALKVFFKNKIDLIVTDIMMPRVDGYELVSTIKSSEEGKHIPIIIMSGTRKDAFDRIKGLNAGAIDYIIKPFEGAELLARIGNFIKLKETQENLQERTSFLEKLVVRLSPLSNLKGVD